MGVHLSFLCLKTTTTPTTQWAQLNKLQSCRLFYSMQWLTSPVQSGIQVNLATLGTLQTKFTAHLSLLQRRNTCSKNQWSMLLSKIMARNIWAEKTHLCQNLGAVYHLSGNFFNSQCCFSYDFFSSLTFERNNEYDFTAIVLKLSFKKILKRKK